MYKSLVAWYNGYIKSNKEQQMPFETKVINLISPALNEGRAEFYSGTLFLEDVTEATARKVFSILCKEFDFKVQPSRFADCFVYDFTA